MLIVRESYPAASLPEDLRGNLPQDAMVRIIIEQAWPSPERVLTLDELWELRGPATYKTSEEIVEALRRMRDEDDRGG